MLQKERGHRLYKISPASCFQFHLGLVSRYTLYFLLRTLVPPDCNFLPTKTINRSRYACYGRKLGLYGKKTSKPA